MSDIRDDLAYTLAESGDGYYRIHKRLGLLGTGDDLARANSYRSLYPGTVALIPTELDPTPPPLPPPPPAGPGGMSTALNAAAAPYGLSPGASPAANTTALKACVADATRTGRNVYIPAGTYLVNSGCLTPPAGTYAQGLEVIGEGKYRSVLRLAPQPSVAYFYDNGSNGNTLSFATFRDLAFEGGPTSTGTERANVNPNHHGFRLYGPTDQSFKFDRCRFGTLNGVIYTAGANNASEVELSSCKVSHIAGYVWRVANLQSLNLNSINSDIEFVWGDVVRTEGTGGGAVNFTMGSIIVQRHALKAGCLVRLEAQQSSTVTFMGCRIEVRNDARLVDGTASTSVGVVNFVSCGTFTTATTGAVETVVVNTDQAVNFDKCTFEHNGSCAVYRVLGTGWLTFDTCALRTSIRNEITKSATGTVIARDCRGRFAQSTRIDFDL